MNSLVLSSLLENSNSSESARMFAKVLDPISPSDMRPSEFVDHCMNEFEKLWEISSGNDQKKRTIVGNYFEFVVGECLMQKGIRPLYYQAVLRYARISKFDWLLFHQENPVLISCKKSARERWKQTAWEAKDLKQIYAGGKCYMITVEMTANVEGKLKEAPNSIDDFIEAKSKNFDNLLEKLSETEYSLAIPESPIYSGIVCQ